VARFLVPGGGLDAGFTAHPSGVTTEEWANVTGPLSIAFGGTYFLLSPPLPNPHAHPAVLQKEL
jgi:hypothetical protein